MARMAASVLIAALFLIAIPSALAAPIWNVESEALPTAFQPSDGTGNDAYDIELENIGDGTSSGTITVIDHLPSGITTSQTPVEADGTHSPEWVCSSGAGQGVVTCTTTAEVAPATATYNKESPAHGPSGVNRIAIPVTVTSRAAGDLTNTVTVTGGGAVTPASSGNPNPVNVGPDAAFGTSFLNFRVIGSRGELFAQAGGHPYAVTTDLQFNQELRPGATSAATAQALEETYINVAMGDEARTIIAELPLGLISDPQAVPRCPVDLFDTATDNTSNCAANTRVGIVYLDRPGLLGPYQVFNLVPESGHAAEFGVQVLGFPIVLYGDVAHTARGYVLRVTTVNPQAVLHAISLTFFGDPAAAFATGEKETPFLTNPVDCAASEEARTLQLHIDTWTDPGIGDPFNGDFSDPAWIPSSATLPPVENCGALTFNPSLSLQPASASEGGATQADSPSGYNFNLEVPQTETYSELATPELQTATVTLPEGLSVSPSAANGLQACSDEQIALESDEPAACPLASQIGTVKVTTPLLEEALEGQVFLGEPECSPCSEADASDGNLFRLYIQVHSEKLGVTFKLPGVVRANPTTGRLTSEFAELPQLPYSDVELKLKDGPRAPLANPQSCGTFTTSSTLAAWSEPQTAAVVSPSSFEVTGCGASTPFSPGFSAGTGSSAAGAYSPFSVTFSRNDGEGDVSGITVSTPPGLLGKLAGVPRCGEAEANAGTCAAASQIGVTTVTAGPGGDPYTITGGRVYLTGPYKGQPFGLSIVAPAVAGPFNLGNVIVRASIAINPSTAAVTIAANPLPQIVDGVPIRLRSVAVEVNRPDFMFNATNCTEQSIGSTITSAQGASFSSRSPYAASGCANLPFKPKLTASARGKASKADGASLNVKLESAGLGQANIAKVDLQLPKTLPSRLTTLHKACVEAVFNANPAACNPESVIGKATIHTPVLNSPLTGPTYLVSHGGAAFPDVEFVLQGEGVTLVLDGKTAIKKGITYSNFEATPDAPFTTFETELPTGPHSILTANVPAKANYSLCGRSLVMPTKITGQNGAVIEQTTKIAVTGCKAAKPLTRAEKLAKALKTCRKKHKHSKKKRASCEKTARKHYGKRHKHTAKGGKSSLGKGRK